MLDADATAAGLLVQHPIQIGALDGVAGSAVGQRLAGAGLAEALAGAAAQRDRRGGETRGQGGLVRAEDAQRVDAVGGQGEECPDAVGAGRAGLVYGGLDPGVPQGHRGGRAGDTAADDQGGAGAGHDCCLSSMLPVLKGWPWNWAHSGPQPVSGWVICSMNRPVKEVSASSSASR